MTFEELGALLSSEREKKNLKITDVANQLKINPRHLRAIEEGDISALPHPAYVRGFIRSYANLLGLGTDEVQELLDTAPALKVGKPQKKAPEKTASEPEKTHSSHTGLKLLAAICLLGAAIYFLWDSGYLDFIKTWQNEGKQPAAELQSADAYMAAKDAEKARREAGQPVVTPPPVEESRGERILPLPGSQPIPTPLTPEPKPVLPPTQMTAEESAAPPQTEELPKNQALATVVESEEAATPGQHKLIITAVEECWIHSNADKTDTRQFSLRKGDTFALTFADSLELKLGNAGGVRLRYDGSDLPPPGSSGQVRTLTFPPKNNS